MLKKLLSVSLCLALMTSLSQNLQAQSIKSGGTNYTNALGMRVEFGTGGTLVGLNGKHFFTSHNAGEAQFLFGAHLVVLGVEYQYHGDIPNAAGLQWYAGLGGALGFTTGYKDQNSTDLFLRPLIGMDYKINKVPLNFAFDWRPTFRATHGDAGDQFTPARFGLAFRYAF